ncbi:hypothetical protein GBN32_12310 [Plesiomonas shigelloides]|uniref:hypothetical protein n=1 Tax=Plesiomonas shigelloides TaxID=703 RepID=UPI0012618287|nr:hypothetical protein [Plesiomonas shigelloides]KAB7709678.1 hypothetical protein GBN32_12310 [Plesiomonas shigelloides]
MKINNKIMCIAGARPEAVTEGVLRLVGAETVDIVREASWLLYERAVYDKMAIGVLPYGQANQRIVDSVRHDFNSKPI